MEIIIGIAVLVVVGVVVFGKLVGPPEPNAMTYESILARLQSEENWVERYKRLPYQQQIGEGISKQYREKQLYISELQLELMKKDIERSGKTPDRAMILVLQDSINLQRTGTPPDEALETAKAPIMNRTAELTNEGLSEEAAFEQARKEFVAARGGV